MARAFATPHSNPNHPTTATSSAGVFVHAIFDWLNAPKSITGFINDYTIISAQLAQYVAEMIYSTFRDRRSDLNIGLGKIVTDALDMWLERSDYDEAFIERRRKILREEEFVSLDEISDSDIRERRAIVHRRGYQKETVTPSGVT